MIPRLLPESCRENTPAWLVTAKVVLIMANVSHMKSILRKKINKQVSLVRGLTTASHEVILETCCLSQFSCLQNETL